MIDRRPPGQATTCPGLMMKNASAVGPSGALSRLNAPETILNGSMVSCSPLWHWGWRNPSGSWVLSFSAVAPDARAHHDRTCVRLRPGSGACDQVRRDWPAAATPQWRSPVRRVSHATHRFLGLERQFDSTPGCRPMRAARRPPMWGLGGQGKAREVYRGLAFALAPSIATAAAHQVAATQAER